MELSVGIKVKTDKNEQFIVSYAGLLKEEEIDDLFKRLKRAFIKKLTTGEEEVECCYICPHYDKDDAYDHCDCEGNCCDEAVCTTDL